MKKHYISCHLTSQLIEALYDKATNTVRTDETALKWFETTVGFQVQQGCIIISPILFNLFLEKIMMEAMEDFERAVSVAGLKVYNLRFADDIDLIGGSIEELTNITERLDGTTEKYGMEISNEKRFADDIDLIGGSIEELTNITERLDGTTEKYGMEISNEKSLIMVTSRHQDQ